MGSPQGKTDAAFMAKYNEFCSDGRLIEAFLQKEPVFVEAVAEIEQMEAREAERMRCLEESEGSPAPTPGECTPFHSNGASEEEAAEPPQLASARRTKLRWRHIRRDAQIGKKARRVAGAVYFPLAKAAALTIAAVAIGGIHIYEDTLYVASLARRTAAFIDDMAAFHLVRSPQSVRALLDRGLLLKLPIPGKGTIYHIEKRTPPVMPVKMSRQQLERIQMQKDHELWLASRQQQPNHQQKQQQIQHPTSRPRFEEELEPPPYSKLFSLKYAFYPFESRSTEALPDNFISRRNHYELCQRRLKNAAASDALPDDSRKKGENKHLQLPTLPCNAVYQADCTFIHAGALLMGLSFDSSLHVVDLLAVADFLRYNCKKLQRTRLGESYGRAFLRGYIVDMTESEAIIHPNTVQHATSILNITDKLPEIAKDPFIAWVEKMEKHEQLKFLHQRIEEALTIANYANFAAIQGVVVTPSPGVEAIDAEFGRVMLALYETHICQQQYNNVADEPVDFIGDWLKQNDPIGAHGNRWKEVLPLLGLREDDYGKGCSLGYQL